MAAPAKALGTLGTLLFIGAIFAASKIGLFQTTESSLDPAPIARSSEASEPPKGAQPAAPTSVPAQTPAAPSRPGGGSKPAAGASQTSTLRFGTWNIEWLGKPEDRSGAGKDKAQSPTDLADLIHESGVSVLAVEEVVTRQKGTPLRSPEIEATVQALKSKSGAIWDYVLFPGRADGDQLTGVLWNCEKVTALNAAGKPWVQSDDSPMALPIVKGRGPSGSALWNRPPHAMKFSAGPGKTDFVFVVLHMKADYNGDFAAHREKEAEALVATLTGLKTSLKDQDIVLLGDTNCTGDHEAAIADFEAAGFVDLNTKRSQTHWRGGTMDRILTPKDQPEFSTRTFEVISDSYMRKRGMQPKDYKARFSDHFMVVSTLTVGEDDD